MKKLFAKLLLITEDFVKTTDKIEYIWSVITNLAPVAFILNLVGWWWEDNEQFGNFMCIILIINAMVGVWFHLKYKSFKWRLFIVRNLELTFLVIVGYVTMETLRYTAGDNFAGEAFKVLIQISTLLFPASKILKNVFIISKGKYPPKFFMEKLYNFEKSGDLSDFFNSKTKDDEAGK